MVLSTPLPAPSADSPLWEDFFQAQRAHPAEALSTLSLALFLLANGLTQLQVLSAHFPSLVDLPVVPEVLLDLSVL